MSLQHSFKVSEQSRKQDCIERVPHKAAHLATLYGTYLGPVILVFRHCWLSTFQVVKLFAFLIGALIFIFGATAEDRELYVAVRILFEVLKQQRQALTGFGEVVV